MRQDNKNKKLKSKKPRLEPGGMFKPTDQLSGATGLAGTAAGMIDPLIKDTNVAGKGLTGLAKGAAAGAALGPVGAIAGGLVGGITGVIGANKAKKAEEQAEFEQKKAAGLYNATQGFANAGNQFKDGGVLLAKKLNTVKGGSLNPISDNAVEVKAKNPSKTDSVELDEAFVDHNEVIDRKNRVYSDSVFLPNGKSVAKEAKKLEKQKAEDYEFRFAGANKLIDQKLDNLFNYQETTKPKEKTVGLKNGGRLNNEPAVGTGKYKHIYNKGGKMKPSYEDGTENIFGKIPLVDVPALPKKVDFSLPLNKDGQYISQSQPYSSNGMPAVLNKPEKSKVNWADNLQTATATLATFGPNIAADALRRKLKGPQAPFLEQGVKLKRLSPDAQLAAASQQTRQAQEIVRRSTAQGSDAVSAQGSLLARRLNANNEIYGNVNNANAQIQAQEASLNSSIRARNVERTNQFRDNQVEFNNKLQQLKSENIANLSSKILQQGRERNIMKLDKKKFDILSKQYSDLPAEMKVRYPTVFDYYNSKEGKKFGGRIAHKLNKKK